MADNTRQGTNQHIERIIYVWPGKHPSLDGGGLGTDSSFRIDLSRPPGDDVDHIRSLACVDRLRRPILSV